MSNDTLLILVRAARRFLDEVELELTTKSGTAKNRLYPAKSTGTDIAPGAATKADAALRRLGVILDE